VSGTQPVAWSAGLHALGLAAKDAQLLFLRSPREITVDYNDGMKAEFLSEFTIAPRTAVLA
jgi:hypothetical protein